MTSCDIPGLPGDLTGYPGVQRGVAYAQAVVSGEKKANRKVKAACARFFEDLERTRQEGCFFEMDVEKAERPISFMEKFLSPTKQAVHAEDARMHLMDFQCFMLLNVFGFVHKKTRMRRFREVLMLMGSGNGKSTLMSGLAAYMASKDGEPGAHVDLFANSRDQAGIVFEECKLQIERSPQLRDRFRTLRTVIYYDPTDSRIRSFASDSGRLDGLNPHCAIFDEIHEFGDFKLVNIVKRKLIKRRQPLVFYLTTQGRVNDGPLDRYYQLFSDALVDGKLPMAVRDRLFGLIYELDEEDALTDEENWCKPNPAMGYLLDREEMHNTWLTVRNVPQERADFICKNLNLKVNADEATYVDWSVLKKNDGTADIESLRGRMAYAGFDLSTREDFTAACVVVPLDDGREFVLHHSWVPRKKLDTYPEGADFYSWAMSGYLSIVDAEYIEQDQVAEWLLKQARYFELMRVGYDPANARWTVMQLESKHVTCDVVRQGPLTLNDPMKDLKEMLLDRRIVSNNDPMLRWYMDNVRLSRESRHTDKANWMPTKKKKSLKIDGFMAFLFAHTCLMRARRPERDEDDAGFTLFSL